MGEDRRNSAPTAALAAVVAAALAAVAAVAVATGYIASTAASQATTFASSAVATTVAVAVVLFILDSCHTCVSKSPTVANPRARPVASTDAAMSSPQLPPHHRYPPHHYHYHPPHHTTPPAATTPCQHNPSRLVARNSGHPGTATNFTLMLFGIPPPLCVLLDASKPL